MMSVRHLGKLLSGQRTTLSNKTRWLSSAAPLVDIQMNEKTGVATISMQKAPVNGLNLELLRTLSETFDELSANRSRGAILTSTLPTIFSGGLDITEMYKPDPTRLREFWSTLQEVWLKLYGSNFPTAAAINGHSPAGGCLLAMSCEYRVMVSGKYTIGLNETALGIIAPTWFQSTMKNTIAPRQAEIALTLGKLFSVDEALKIGLIDEAATDKADAIAKAEQFIARFDRINPQARSMTKRLFRGDALRALEETRDQDVDMFVMAVTNAKVQKSLEMYMQALKNKGK